MAIVVGHVDTPDGQSPIPAGAICIAGWAYSASSSVSRVEVWLDGRWIGRARLGLRRPDVSSALDDPEADSSGFELVWVDPSASRAGRADLQLTVTVEDGTEESWPALQLEFGSCRFAPPSPGWDTANVRGGVDAPDGRSPVEVGELHISGWAYGTANPVSRVDVWLDGRCLGRAGLGRARPDVAAALGEPDAALSGFEFHSLLPAGTSERVSLQLTAILLDGTEEPSQSFELSVAATIDATCRSASSLHRDERRARGRRRRPRAIRILWSARGLDLGGSQLRMAELIDHLARIGGFESTVVAPGDGALRRPLEATGARVHIRPPAPLNDLQGYEQSVSALCSSIDGRFDVVCGATVTSFPAVDAAARLGIPSCLRIGEAASLRTVVGWLIGDTLHPDVESRARWTISRASVVVCTSHAVADTYEEDGYAGRFLVLTPGADIQAARAALRLMDRDECRTRLGIRPGERLVACVGSRWPVKGQAMLVDAFRRLHSVHPDLGCVLLGLSDAAYENPIVDLVDRYGLQSAVRILPFCDDLRPWWRAADAAACPSESEAMPAAVLEAMSFGLPVLGCRVGDVPRLIDEGRTGWLCDHSDLASMMAALDGLARTPREDMQAMGARAAREVATGHDRQVILDRWATLLKAVARGRFPRRLSLNGHRLNRRKGRER